MQERSKGTSLAIQSEYNELTAKLGQVQYQVYVYTKEQERLNAALIRVNNEATARQQLDAANKPPVTAAEVENTKSGAV